MKTLPAYTTEPGIPGDLTDLIVDRTPDCNTPNEARRIPWISSYQGEVDFQVGFGHLNGRRISWRYAKVPWRWSFQREGERYWNFGTEEEFQSQVNGAWGIIHCSANPIDAATLEEFRRYHPLAVTGYYDHLTRSWVICEPTTQELGTESWKQSQSYRDFMAEHPQYARNFEELGDKIREQTHNLRFFEDHSG